jgi:hypothetical protein
MSAMRVLSLLFFPLSAFAVFLSCNNQPVSPVHTDPPVIPYISIADPSFIYWCRDSAFEDLIYPTVLHHVPGEMDIYIGAFDYTCTVLPDTCFGVAVYQFSEPETLSCFCDTCWIRGDTAAHDMREYRARLANALCSEKAIAYTANGLCYHRSAGEETVRLFNSCFDTAFSGGEICLPKVPLDSQLGVWFVSIDTFFCSADFINTHDDYFTRQDVKNQ